ncbi:MAG: Phospholipase YtpA [Promethearchaeota archaeon]|jgi:alpha-beta hydrolase superfamily lysophospholipase|nr:MAG: Phospholipase YtpA [Candidatus Lokiarchaeota archaeon]
MKNEKGFFEGNQGRKLFYQYWTPDSGKTKASILALHGLGTHSHRLETPAEYFTEKGYAVFSFDLRGHWMNIRKIPGHIENIDNIEKDIIHFKEIIYKEGGTDPIFIMGHSLGGLVSLRYGIHYPENPGIIVSSPLLGFNTDVFLEKTVGSLMARISPTNIIEFEIDQNKLTSDLKILRKQIADTHVIKQITYSTYSEINSTMKWVMKHASGFDCPLLLMQAGNDKITDKKQVRNFFKKVKSRDKTYKEYDGLLHDILHEKQRLQVYRDIYIWLEKHM